MLGGLYPALTKAKQTNVKNNKLDHTYFFTVKDGRDVIITRNRYAGAHLVSLLEHIPLSLLQRLPFLVVWFRRPASLWSPWSPQNLGVSLPLNPDGVLNGDHTIEQLQVT